MLRLNPCKAKNVCENRFDVVCGTIFIPLGKMLLLGLVPFCLSRNHACIVWNLSCTRSLIGWSYYAGRPTRTGLLLFESEPCIVWNLSLLVLWLVDRSMRVGQSEATVSRRLPVQAQGKFPRIACLEQDMDWYNLSPWVRSKGFALTYFRIRFQGITNFLKWAQLKKLFHKNTTWFVLFIKLYTNTLYDVINPLICAGVVQVT
jgi:hypothetical protein